MQKTDNLVVVSLHDDEHEVKFLVPTEGKTVEQIIQAIRLADNAFNYIRRLPGVLSEYCDGYEDVDSIDVFMEIDIYGPQDQGDEDDSYDDEVDEDFAEMFLKASEQLARDRAEGLAGMEEFSHADEYWGVNKPCAVTFYCNPEGEHPHLLQAVDFFRKYWQDFDVKLDWWGDISFARPEICQPIVLTQYFRGLLTALNDLAMLAKESGKDITSQVEVISRAILNAQKKLMKGGSDV